MMMMKSEVKEIENGVGVGCIVDAFSLSRERGGKGRGCAKCTVTDDTNT